MTPAQLDHLRAIDAHLAKLLDIAAKRTPWEWTVTDGVYDYSPEASQFPEGPSIRLSGNDDILFNLGQEPNAAFIASCAGNAEAGWKATRAAIALCIANLHTDPEFPTHAPDWLCDNDSRGCRACGYTDTMLLQSILAAFPLESLNP